MGNKIDYQANIIPNKNLSYQEDDTSDMFDSEKYTFYGTYINIKYMLGNAYNGKYKRIYKFMNDDTRSQLVKYTIQRRALKKLQMIHKNQYKIAEHNIAHCIRKRT